MACLRGTRKDLGNRNTERGTCSSWLKVMNRWYVCSQNVLIESQNSWIQWWQTLTDVWFCVADQTCMSNGTPASRRRQQCPLCISDVRLLNLSSVCFTFFNVRWSFNIVFYCWWNFFVLVYYLNLWRTEILPAVVCVDIGAHWSWWYGWKQVLLLFPWRLGLWVRKFPLENFPKFLEIYFNFSGKFLEILIFRENFRNDITGNFLPLQTCQITVHLLTYKETFSKVLAAPVDYSSV